MSIYTIELGKLLDAEYDIGLMSYPIFDSNYRALLNSKIKEHFRFREIGFEMPARFVYMLNRTLNEIMPLYNQYYRQALTTFGILDTTDFLETYTKTSTGIAHSETTSLLEGSGTTVDDVDTTNTQTITGLDTEHDTPQNSVANLDNFMSKAKKKADTIEDTTTNDSTKTTDTSESGSSTNDANNTLTESYSHTIKGRNMRSPHELIMQARASFINIDMMVIADLETCFMGIY